MAGIDPLTDKPAWIKSSTTADWLKFDPASDYDGELSFDELRNNTFVALLSATRRNRDGILVLITILDEDTHWLESIFIHWDWRTYPSTANFIEAGIPGTDYSDWVYWMNDYNYPPTSSIVIEIKTRLQSLINDRRDEANLPVDDTDRVEV